MKAGALIALILVASAALITLRGRDTLGGDAPPAPVDFVVADSRDAGPGTLRDAILAADRSTTRIRILVKAKRIILESALPAIINANGVRIDAAPDAGVIDADQVPGVAVSVDSPGAVLRGLHVSRAHGSAILVNAAGVQLDAITVSDSKVGVFLGPAANACSIRNAIFERNETALTAQSDIRELAVAGSMFRGNTRAAFWLVAAPDKARSPSAVVPADRDVRESARIVDSVFEGNFAGVVVGNRPVSVQKSRFLDTRQSAITILGGSARIEDNDIRGSGAAAILVASGTAVTLTRNTLVDNASMAIMARDSDISIDGNTVRHNALGIVTIVSPGGAAPAIRDNLITQSSADAITLIGGAPIVERNRIIDNRGAGLRALDVIAENGRVKAAPQLTQNLIKGNSVDAPVGGVYKLSGNP
jgi:hypothetical protein